MEADKVADLAQKVGLDCAWSFWQGDLTISEDYWHSVIRVVAECDDYRRRAEQAEALLSDRDLGDALSHEAWDDWNERRAAFLAGGAS